MLRVLALALLASCTLGWEDLPGAPVIPVAEDLEQWTINVEGAINEWGDALTLVGCPRPFEIARYDYGHRIELIAVDQWEHEMSAVGEMSSGSTGRIEIRADAEPGTGQRAPLLHELGHAIGLWHADQQWGPSVLTPAWTSQHLTVRDVAAAACELGCGPCDPAADPYGAR